MRGSEIELINALGEPDAHEVIHKIGGIYITVPSARGRGRGHEEWVALLEKRLGIGLTKKLMAELSGANLYIPKPSAKARNTSIREAYERMMREGLTVRHASSLLAKKHGMTHVGIDKIVNRLDDD